MLATSSLRSKENPIFGFPEPLPANCLPTNSDVLKSLLFYKDQLTQLCKTNKKVEISSFAQPVAHDLLEIWQKASIPTMTLIAVERRLKCLYEKAKVCENRKKPFDEGPKLFDICGCQCSRVTCADVGCASIECEAFHIVHAAFPNKCTVRVDPKELPFLFDQRKERKMIIGGVHVKDTILLQRREKTKEQQKEREEREKQRVKDETESQAKANATFFSETDSDADSDAGSDADSDAVTRLLRSRKRKIDPDYEPEAGPSNAKFYNTMPIPNTAAAADRIGFGNESAVLLCNCYAIDLGVLTWEN